MPTFFYNKLITKIKKLFERRKNDQKHFIQLNIFRLSIKIIRNNEIEQKIQIDINNFLDLRSIRIIN